MFPLSGHTVEGSLFGETISHIGEHTWYTLCTPCQHSVNMHTAIFFAWATRAFRHVQHVQYKMHFPQFSLLACQFIRLTMLCKERLLFISGLSTYEK